MKGDRMPVTTTLHIGNSVDRMPATREACKRKIGIRYKEHDIRETTKKGVRLRYPSLSRRLFSLHSEKS